LTDRLHLRNDLKENFLAIGFKEKLLLWNSDVVGLVGGRYFDAEVMSFWSYLIFKLGIKVPLL